MKPGFIIYLICATLVLFFLSCQLDMDIGGRIVALLFMMVPFVFFPLGLDLMDKKMSRDSEKERARVNNLSEEEKKKYYEQKEKERLDSTIDYTIIVGEDSRKSVGSSVVRGAVGGALLGPVGLVGGAISGKNKSKTTFTVVYKSGRRKVVTVDNDSSEFRTYAQYVR